MYSQQQTRGEYPSTSVSPSNTKSVGIIGTPPNKSQSNLNVSNPFSPKDPPKHE